MEEVRAISICYRALESLSPEAQERALKYLHSRLVETQIDKACAIVLMLNSIGKLRHVLDLSPSTFTVVPRLGGGSK